MDMLSAHDPTCAKRFKEMTSEPPVDQGEFEFTQPMTNIYNITQMTSEGEE